MNKWVKSLSRKISSDAQNKAYKERGIAPLFVADSKARVAIVGQAPGLKAQAAGLAWDDASGERLMRMSQMMFHFLVSRQTAF